MDDFISSYVLTTFTNELQYEVFRSFNLLSDFEYPDFQQPYIDLLMTQGSRISIDTQDYFINKVNEQIDFVINEHTIFLIPDTSLKEKNDFLTALWQIQDLYDYTALGMILESSSCSEEKLAAIISDYSQLNEAEALNVIDRLDDSILDNLKTFITQKISSNRENIESIVDREIFIKNFKQFQDFVKSECSGILMFNYGILTDQPLIKYINIAGEDLTIDDIQILTVNVLSIIYMTKEGINNPLETFRSNSNYFFHDLETISKVDTKLAWLVGQFTDYQKACDEKSRLAQVSSTK